MGKGVRENTLFFILFQRPTHFYLKKIGFNGEDRKRDEKKNGLLATRHKDKKGKSRYYLYGSSASPPLLMVIQGISANGKLITANKIL